MTYIFKNGAHKNMADRAAAWAYLMQGRASAHLPPPATEDPIRTLLVSLLGAAALTAGLILIRQTGPAPLPRPRDMHAGENEPGTISLERLRALGY